MAWLSRRLIESSSKDARQAPARFFSPTTSTLHLHLSLAERLRERTKESKTGKTGEYGISATHGEEAAR